jgi:O-antigen ligase
LGQLQVEQGAGPEIRDAAAPASGGRVQRILAESPSLPLLAVAVVVFAWLAADEGGFHGTTFLPATLVLLALLLIGLVALPIPRPSRVRWIAMGLLTGYAAWSYLSILWADEQGLAWDGANRTLMYAIAFALFALWEIRGKAALMVLGTYTLAVAGIGLVELLRASSTTSPVAVFDEARLSEPTGYANANVALWSSALWPAIVLAGRRGVPWLLRGLFLGSGVLLAALSILGQSRSWAVVLPLTALLMVVIVPGRGRTLAAGGIVAVATAAIATPLLNVYEDFTRNSDPSQLMDSAVSSTLLATALLIAIGMTWGAFDREQSVDAETTRKLGNGIVVAGAVLCVIGLIGFTAVSGNPVTKASDAWHEFKDGGSEPTFEGSRIGTFGGTYRYDYWRVAWNEFADHPLIGVGADNFGREYLREGHSRQTPAYPHSVELRTLSQTGLIGTLLLLGAIAAALVAAARVERRPGGFGGVATATSVVVFAYFILHGSLDWLWEFPGLGAPAFALLGMATAVNARGSGPPRVGLPNAAWLIGGSLVALVVAAGLTLPWLAERELRDAREIAASNPTAALTMLDRAADLNPLSPLAEKTAAVIERRQGRFGASEQRLRSTLDQDPGDPFVYLQLAVIASATDRQQEAVQLIRRAAELSPRDRVTVIVKRRLEAGRHVSPAWVDRLIVSDVDARIGPN